MKLKFRLLTIGMLAAALLSSTGCVATKDGGRKLDPWKAVLRTDSKIDDWLEGMGYPTARN